MKLKVQQEVEPRLPESAIAPCKSRDNQSSPRDTSALLIAAVTLCDNLVLIILGLGDGCVYKVYTKSISRSKF